MNLQVTNSALMTPPTPQMLMFLLKPIKNTTTRKNFNILLLYEFLKLYLLVHKYLGLWIKFLSNPSFLSHPLAFIDNSNVQNSI